MTKVDLLRLCQRVERLIDALKIDTIHLSRAEAARLEAARRELSKATGSPYP